MKPAKWVVRSSIALLIVLLCLLLSVTDIHSHDIQSVDKTTTDTELFIPVLSYDINIHQ